ncbi:RICIN domain-containing protein [Streptomyces sp. NPDC057579]|uniref:RICIN domain-containing protein n=1 Tax=Streptomyces sp. NPDC057579 TaxID=3346172 RepID=UPI0036CD698E
MSTTLAAWMRSRKRYALVVVLLTFIAPWISTAAASASTSGRVIVENNNSNFCMSVPGDKIYAGAPINQYTCESDSLFPDQYWYEEPSSSHSGWFYFQPQQNNTLCATYVPGSTAEITLQYCGVNAANGNTNTQLWHYDYNSGELATMQGWSMSVPGARTDVEPINIYPYGPCPDQYWSVISVP